jgi:Glycosyl hydrolases family 43
VAFSPLHMRRHLRATQRGALPTVLRSTLGAVAALVVVTAVASSTAVAIAPPAGAANWSPVHAGDFPDPSILQWDGVYYGFATQSFSSAGDITNIQVSTSPDGVNWTPSGIDALPALPSWAEVGDTWAPSVAHSSVGNDFVMYYTATEASTGDQCIGVATSGSATGPYTDANAAPVVCDNGVDPSSTTLDDENWGGSIDPDVFTDDAGNSFLLWKDDGNHIGVSTPIRSVPLTSNLLAPAGQPTTLLWDDEQWQSNIIEGPDMVENQGSYYLFYAGSDEGASTYAIGWASCPSGPTAGCSDMSTTGPLLATSPGVSGPGGPDVFTLRSSGQLVMAFAGWQGSTIGYLSCGLRPMYLATLTFSSPGGAPSLAPATDTGPATSPSCPASSHPPPGYWQVGADGGIFTFGDAQFYGSTGSIRLNKPVVGMAATPDGGGYWLVASDGGVFAYGDAQFYGSTGGITLNKPIIGLIPSIDGGGYWLIASDGGVFAYGDAKFYGSTGGSNLGYPITAAAPGYLGGGYWMVDANGQVFSFGDTRFEGQPAYAPGGYRITGMAGTQNSSGYWLASANGNVADFGDAAPYGSMAGTTLNAPVVGMTTTADGAGYWLQGSDGGIFTFGNAGFYGSMGGKHLNAPMVGIAAT